MRLTEFIDLLDIWALTRIFFFQICVFFFLYRITRVRQPSFFDPFTLSLFFCASGWGIVLELCINYLCPPHLLIMFLASTAAFLMGYLFVAPNLTNFKTSTQLVRSNRHAWYGMIILVIYLAAAVLNVILFGFGINYENRLDIYTESAGLGVLKRFLDALMPGAIFYLVYQMNFRKGLIRIVAITLFILVSLNTILDGSKSGLVAIFFAYVISIQWLRMSNLLSQDIHLNRIWHWILMSIIFSIVVLIVQLEVTDDFSRFIDILGVLFFRIILAGDIFILGFPQGNIDTLMLSHNPILILFSDFLLTFRFWVGEIIPLGTQLIRDFNPELMFISGGPNAHLSIYGYYLFGSVGGTLLSFLFGALFGAVRLAFSKTIGNDIVAGSLVITLLLNTANILIDPSYTMHRITNIMLLLPLVLCFIKIKFRSN
jgi:hypothetical protein